ncbi:MAG: hypothetical protein JSS82_13910 [Bacteroidetes bacterium]|nr:hypothetical protein [Bacteroidota bacterium]
MSVRQEKPEYEVVSVEDDAGFVKWTSWASDNVARLDVVVTAFIVVFLLFAVISGCVTWYNYKYQGAMGGMLQTAWKFDSGNYGFELISHRMSGIVPFYFNLNVSMFQNLNMENGAGLHFYPTAPPTHSRGILPSTHQNGIFMHAGIDSIIDMDGGNIINVHDLIADYIYGNVASRVNGSTEDNIAPGLAVGLLLNGNVSVGFSPNPGSYPEVVNQVNEISTGSFTLYSVARIGASRSITAFIADDGSVMAYASTRDPVSGVTTNTVPVEILATGLAVARTIKLVSLGLADGSTANSTALIYVKDSTSDNIYVRVIDFTDPEVPTFQDPFGTVDPGFGVLKNINPVVQDAVAIPHTHVAGEPASSRWIILAFSDTSGNNTAVPLTANETAAGTPVFTNVNGGWVYGFNVLADVTATYTFPFNHTSLRQIGAVTGATDESTSTDLAGNCASCIKLQFGGVNQQYGVSSRAGGSLEGLQFEMEQLILPAKTLNLTANGRYLNYTLDPTKNPNGDTVIWDAALGNVDGSGVQYYHTAYGIGLSQFGGLFSLRVASGASTTDSYSGKFGNMVLQPDTSYTGSLISVAATCADRLIITYTTTTLELLHTVSVLISSTTPSFCSPAGCQYTGTPVYASAYEAYSAQTVWQNLASTAYSCSSLTSFFTTYAAYDQTAVYNTTIHSVTGEVGVYTLTYATQINPIVVVGVSSGFTNLTSGIIQYQTSGVLDLSTTTYGILGRTCPYEAPFDVYACVNGSLTGSQFCDSISALNPSPRVGRANVDCTLTIEV